MHVPGLLERVRLCGFDEVYLVIRVDHVEQAADLLPIVYGRRAVRSIHPLPRIGTDTRLPAT